MSDECKALAEWLGGIPEPGTSILAGRNLQTKVPMSDDSLMTIYGDDGPCDLYRGYDNVASGSREAMRAAERLLSGRCEIGSRFEPATFGGLPFPFEYTGHWVREMPAFRQEYDLHFVPDKPVIANYAPTIWDTPANLDTMKAEMDAWVRAGRICVARDERVQAAATLAQALHNDDEPGQ